MKTMPYTARRIEPPVSDTEVGPFKITLKMYHQMIDAGILTAEDRCELIEGLLYRKEKMNPPHARIIRILRKWLLRILPDEWDVDSQLPVTLNESEPEPDLAIIRSDIDEYGIKHPGPNDIGLLIEVSDTSLRFDRKRKLRVYVRAGVPIYWIVNIPDKQIEVHSQPINGEKAKYGRSEVYKVGDEVPLILDGEEIAQLKVSQLFPIKI